jgi:spore germination protein KC
MKKVVVFLLILMTVLMTGCWNYREIETLSIVAGFAIDKGNGGTGYHLTIETLDTSGGGGSGSQTSVKSKIIEMNGDTLFDAVRNAVEISDKKLYWGDCKTAIISNQLASEGIDPILDWIGRDSELRLTQNIFVSKEQSAAEIIKQKSLANPITSYAINKADQNNQQYLLKSPYMQLYKVNDTLGAEGESLYLPALDISKQNENSPELAGTAIFEKDKLLGFLGSEETKYLLFIKNQVAGGLLLVNENSAVPNITLEIKKSSTKISTVLTGKTPKIEISIKTEANLGEMETATDLKSVAFLKKVEKDAGSTLENKIKQLISKDQNEYGSDIFGFGNTIYQSNPYYWDQIKPKWNQLFKSLNVEVSATVEIGNTALSKTKVKGGE